MNSKEKELVTEDFCNREDTYNICPGGKGGFGYINKNCHNNRNNRRKTGNHGWRIKPVINPENVRLGLKKYFETHPGHWLGRKHSEESKKKISEKSKIHQAGKGNSQYGSMWINNGLENRKIKKDEFPFWNSKGYISGRKMKFSNNGV